MKLSQLIHYKNELDKLSINASRQLTDNETAQIDFTIAAHNISIDNYTNDLPSKYQLIKQAFDDYQQSLDQLKSAIDDKITQEERIYFQESYQRYDAYRHYYYLLTNNELYVEGQPINFPVKLAPEIILERKTHMEQEVLDKKMHVSEETFAQFTTRLYQHTNWQGTGMIIRPGREKFIDQLTANDPLYLVDESYELLQPTLDRFNTVYQNRVRKYIINESSDNILAKLPDGQFGVCLVYNFFNYRPFELIKQYLQEIYAKLKPGGTLIMTFNNCDYVQAVELAESHFASYTPGKLLKSCAERIGYEIHFELTNCGSTWLELKRPGTFESIRGGQILAKIMPK
jgi:SAM-dependent methyltransferase